MSTTLSTRISVTHASFSNNFAVKDAVCVSVENHKGIRCELYLDYLADGRFGSAVQVVDSKVNGPTSMLVYELLGFVDFEDSKELAYELFKVVVPGITNALVTEESKDLHNDIINGIAINIDNIFELSKVAIVNKQAAKVAA